MEKTKWKHIKSGKQYEASDLIGELNHKKKGVIVLSGPSGCGKTMLLREMKGSARAAMRIYSYRDAVDSIIHFDDIRNLPGEIPCFDKPSAGIIWAIEDMDYLAGKEYTRRTIYDKAAELAEDSLVIFSGIGMETRLQDLFCYFPDADLYCAMARSENSPSASLT